MPSSALYSKLLQNPVIALPDHCCPFSTFFPLAGRWGELKLPLRAGPVQLLSLEAFLVESYVHNAPHSPKYAAVHCSRRLRSDMKTLFTKVPEAGVVFFSFVFHFVWEMLQVPTYLGMSDIPHWDGVVVCAQATIGDVAFALAAFWLAAVLKKSRAWMSNPDWQAIALFLLVGLALTIGFEFYYTQVTYRWAYSTLMPVVPPFGTGVSPLVQWIVVPLLVVEMMRKTPA